MKRKFLLMLLLGGLGLRATPGVAQRYRNFSVNAGVSTASPNQKTILARWDDYLGSGFRRNQEFWAPDELARYANGDALLSEGYVNPNVYRYSTEKIVLGLQRIDSSLYRCKTQFYWRTPADSAQPMTVFCTIATYFRREQNRWLLANNLTYYTRDWTTATVGNLVYRLPPGRDLNRQKAETAQAFLAGVFKEFAIPPFPVTYYLAPDCEAVMRMKGFDYVVGMDANAVCGFYDAVNHIVYAGGQGELYLHELAHVINPYFPKAHELFLTGYSAVRGGHHGHDLAYHKRRVRAYLATHPVDLSNPLKFYSLDDDTNPQYVIGGIFCEAALKQGGTAKLKRLFGYGTADEDFFVALKQEFGLDKKDLNKFIRAHL